MCIFLNCIGSHRMTDSIIIYIATFIDMSHTYMTHNILCIHQHVYVIEHIALFVQISLYIICKYTHIGKQFQLPMHT